MPGQANPPGTKPTVRLNAVERDGDLLHCDITTPNGQRWRWTFPVDTMEWRAAEYGIDPSNEDTLLSIMIAEPYLPPADPARLLYTAASVADARAHHLERLAQVTVDRDPAAWEQAKAHGRSAMHPVAVGLKREHVARGRAVMAQAIASGEFDPSTGRRRRLPKPAADRIALLAASLNPKRGTTRA